MRLTVCVLANRTSGEIVRSYTVIAESCSIFDLSVCIHTAGIPGLDMVYWHCDTAEQRIDIEDFVTSHTIHGTGGFWPVSCM